MATGDMNSTDKKEIYDRLRELEKREAVLTAKFEGMERLLGEMNKNIVELTASLNQGKGMGKIFVGVWSIVVALVSALISYLFTKVPS